MGFFGNYRAFHELQINGRNPEEDENQNRTADEPDDPAPADPETQETPPAETPPTETPPEGGEEPAPTADEPADPAGGEIPDTPEDYEIPDGAEPPAETLPPTADEPDDPAPADPETQGDDPEAGTEPAPTGDEPADPDIPAGDGDYTDTGDAGAETPPTEGEEGTDPDIPAGDGNYTDDGAGGTEGDPGTGGGGDPDIPADDAGGDGGATSSSQIANDLKSLEDEIFGDLSDQQKDIRDNELKSSYIALYNTIDEAEKRINNIVKNENTGKVLEFITRKMNELKQLIHHNLTVVYSTRTYVENQTALQECIAIMNIICTMLESIAKEDEKHKEE